METARPFSSSCSSLWTSNRSLFTSAAFLAIVLVLNNVQVPADALHTGGGRATLISTLENCTNEGEAVFVALVVDNPCVSNCRCKNGYVQCEKQSCPNNHGCHIFLQGKSDKCCDVCKGCEHNGVHYASGAEWADAGDACRVMTCQSGVVTVSRLTCHVPCDHPLPPRPGECCPSCPDCTFQGKQYREGEEVVSKEDPCLKCRCHKGGMLCSLRACPVLNCPAMKEFRPPGACCPECKSGRKVFELRGRCLLGHKVHVTGSWFNQDACTNCTCQDTTSVCERQTCPTSECPPERLKYEPGVCCPTCQPILDRNDRRTPVTTERVVVVAKVTPIDLPVVTPPATIFSGDPYIPLKPLPVAKLNTCSYKGNVYKDGSTWSMGACTACSCNQGEVRCRTKQCPAPRQWLPRGAEGKLKQFNTALSDANQGSCQPGFHSVVEPGQCCPKCVEDDAVCTVFGDPHYRTFDGRVFNFQGACKYLLTSDCKNQSFSIRVTNDARASQAFSWTKSVTLQIKDMKLTLGQKMKVKVNHKHVTLPFVSLGVFSVVQEGYSVVVRTDLGVKLLWDGDSFLEVTVPPSFKNKLCGLCGNYNGRKQDDFKLRNGKTAKSIPEFGNSWRIGGNKSCSRPDPVPGTETNSTATESGVTREPLCQRQWEVRIRAIRECSALKSATFKPCHKRVSPIRYFKSCLLDMCECPRGKKCYCEALTAYIHECSRAGVDIKASWRTETSCTGHLISNV